MSKFGKFLSEVFFPENFTCDLCGRETFGTNLCEKCASTVTLNDQNVCPICGRRTERNEICFECKDAVPLFKQAISPLVYEGGVCKLIHKFKNGDAYLKNYFARLIAEKLKLIPAPDVIVYVPMTKKAVFKRGYNQSELLAKSVSELTEIPVIKNALVKVKDTSEQKTLSMKERAENLKGCFKVEKRDEIKRKRVLLIDDVLTTGATSETITSKLLKAGASAVYLATVASVEFKL